jgi:JmjC domain, hydroxylase
MNCLDIVPCNGEYLEFNSAIKLLDLARKGEIASPVYMNGWEYAVGDNAERLKALLLPVDYLKTCQDGLNLLEGTSLQDLMKWIFIGSKGSLSKPHIDGLASSAWLWLLCGTKEWTFSKQSVADGSEKVFKLTQNASDLMVIPAGWTHGVVNTEFTIAVSHNWVEPENKANLNSEIWKALKSEDSGDSLMELLLLERADQGFYFKYL